MMSAEPGYRLPDTASAGQPEISRRTLLRTVAATGLCAALPNIAGSLPAAVADGQTAITSYLESLARSDGGYAWSDQPQSHLTPTFAVIGCYRLLKQQPPRKDRLADFVRTHHPFRVKKLERELRVFEFQQIQSLIWLGGDASAFRELVRRWTKPSRYPAQYEQHSYPIFRFELMAFLCRELLSMPLDDLSPQLIDYLKERRRANGSFNNTPAADKSDGHVMNTWWGLQALRALGRANENKERTIAWLQACQLTDGGFTYQPRAEIAGVSNVVYTWAAVRALRQLDAAPANRDDCIHYLRALGNADGGCGDRLNWTSNPVATYYTLDALDALASAPPVRKPSTSATTSLPRDLKVYTIQIEAHGQGSPAEAVDLARALRIHLWGAKNAKPQWLARAQALADEQKVPVKFFIANEEYGTWVSVPGLGTYSHTSDIFAPAGAEFGPSLANQGVVTWPEFRQRRLEPLQKAGGRLIWQFGENEELTRIFLDDSIQRGGFAAISTFHFGNPDFTNSSPYLKHYQHRIPYIALQDAHGREPWWFADMTEGFRTVFLATEPTWEGWITALRNNWVAAIRHDAVSGNRTWMHGGPPEVLDFVRRNSRDWQWWDNPEIRRPLVSVVAVTPEDEFEAARPEKGVMLRIRCAWENTTQGLPKRPLTELVKLLVDGAEVSPMLIAKQRKGNAAFEDYYHQFHLPNPTPGNHTAKAIVRRIDTKADSSRTIEFHA
ncbi:MAG TPA: prenyltransferase/squalene oxidase repeat-containing protein [Gemmataceae bacterium]|jgi:hypothetical protein